MPYTDTNEVLRRTAGIYHADTPELRIGLLPVDEAELAWINTNAGQRYGVFAQRLQSYELEAAYVAQANQRAQENELSQREAAAERAVARRFARGISERAGLTAVRFVVTPAHGHNARTNSYSFQIALAHRYPEHVSRYAELCLCAARQAMAYNGIQEQ